jgi:hypothetical protein
MSQYVYSLNGENWAGAFETRDAALAAAIAKCSGAIDPPGTVFVAELATGDAFADHLGKVVVEQMRAKARGSEAGAKYLRGISATAMKDLDSDLERTVISWLQKHALLPQTSKVEAISEHSVPLPHRGLTRGVNGKEVQDLGTAEFPGDAVLNR